MESNQNLRYVDTTPASRVSKKTLTKMIWRSCQLQAAFNYERMQSAGWLWAMYQVYRKSIQTKMT